MTSLLVDTSGNILKIERGTSPTHTFAITDEDTGDAKSLVGATEVTLAIAQRRESRARDLTLTLSSGITTDGLGGIVTAVITKEQTEALPVGQRWAELWITDFAGVRALVAAGPCLVENTLIAVP